MCRLQDCGDHCSYKYFNVFSRFLFNNSQYMQLKIADAASEDDIHKVSFSMGGDAGGSARNRTGTTTETSSSDTSDHETEIRQPPKKRKCDWPPISTQKFLPQKSQKLPSLNSKETSEHNSEEEGDGDVGKKDSFEKEIKMYNPVALDMMVIFQFFYQRI